MSGFDPEYLAAKAAVDNRSVNLRVWNRFVEEFGRLQRPRRILDLGAGTGSLLHRFLAEPEFRDFTYNPLDSDGALLETITAGLDPVLLEKRGCAVYPRNAVLEDFLSESTQKWDVLVSNAFLDLLDLTRLAGPILSCLVPGGIFYFSFVFDGCTALLPRIDPGFDEAAIDLYHASMEGGGRSGSRAGRVVLEELLRRKVPILDAGPSDWAVLPTAGGYPEGAGVFLGRILDFFEGVLLAEDIPDRKRARAWLRLRREQLEAGELAFFTHQWDILGKIPGETV